MGVRVGLSDKMTFEQTFEGIMGYFRRDCPNEGYSATAWGQKHICSYLRMARPAWLNQRANPVAGHLLVLGVKGEALAHHIGLLRLW